MDLAFRSAAPHHLRQRGITDEEYAHWLNDQSKKIWRRGSGVGNTAFAHRLLLRDELNRVMLASDGRNYYTGSRLYWKHRKAGGSTSTAT